MKIFEKFFSSKKPCLEPLNGLGMTGIGFSASKYPRKLGFSQKNEFFIFSIFENFLKIK